MKQLPVFLALTLVALCLGSAPARASQHNSNFGGNADGRDGNGAVGGLSKDAGDLPDGPLRDALVALSGYYEKEMDATPRLNQTEINDAVVHLGKMRSFADIQILDLTRVEIQAFQEMMNELKEDFIKHPEGRIAIRAVEEIDAVNARFKRLLQTRHEFPLDQAFQKMSSYLEKEIAKKRPLSQAQLGDLTAQFRVFLELPRGLLKDSQPEQIQFLLIFVKQADEWYSRNPAGRDVRDLLQTLSGLKTKLKAIFGDIEPQ